MRCRAHLSVLALLLAEALGVAACSAAGRPAGGAVKTAGAHPTSTPAGSGSTAVRAQPRVIIAAVGARCWGAPRSAPGPGEVLRAGGHVADPDQLRPLARPRPLPGTEAASRSAIAALACVDAEVAAVRYGRGVLRTHQQTRADQVDLAARLPWAPRERSHMHPLSAPRLGAVFRGCGELGPGRNAGVRWRIAATAGRR